MTRSSDRTLLASLGFQDPDHRDARHTLACQYLARPEIAEKVWRRVLPKAFEPFPGELKRGSWFGGTVGKPGFEVPILKGEGKFKVTVGFLDVVLWLDYTKVRETGGKLEGCEWDAELAIEVKANRVDVGDIARQMALYQEFAIREHARDPESYYAKFGQPGTREPGPKYHWAVACTWQMAPEDKAILTGKGIEVLWLGPPFEKYCAERQKATPSGEDDPL